MPTPLHLKPAFAAWLVRERNSRKWKPRDVVTALAAQNITITEGTVKVWESNSNRTPSPTTIEALERIFDSRAPVKGGRAAESDGDLAQAIREQTRVMGELVQAIGLLVNRPTDLTELMERRMRIDERIATFLDEKVDRQRFLEQMVGEQRAEQAIDADEGEELRTRQSVPQPTRG